MSTEKRALPAGFQVIANPVDPIETEAVQLADFLEAEYPKHTSCIGEARIMHMNAPRNKVRERAEQILREQRNWNVEFYPFENDTHNEFGVFGGEFHMSPTGRRLK